MALGGCFHVCRADAHLVGCFEEQKSRLVTTWKATVFGRALSVTSPGAFFSLPVLPASLQPWSSGGPTLSTQEIASFLPPDYKALHPCLPSLRSRSHTRSLGPVSSPGSYSYNGPRCPPWHVAGPSPLAGSLSTLTVFILLGQSPSLSASSFPGSQVCLSPL